MSESLKPCPFCGGEAIVSFDPDAQRIQRDENGRIQFCAIIVVRHLDCVGLVIWRW